jgi:hypothetical protein
MAAATTSSRMAVSTLCRAALFGPRVALTPSYLGPDAWYLRSPAGREGHPPRGLSVVTPHAVLLPESVVVPDLPTGAPQLSIGDGALWYGDHRVTVSRWFTPPRVVRGALRGLATSPGLVRRLVNDWRDRLGKGDGLTPYGDDVICGVMLGLLAIDHADADRLAGELRESPLEERTTALSAALLRCAADGWCIPPVERFLVSLSGETSTDRAAEALLAVGHSSGRGLLAGLASVIDLPHPGLAA